MEKALTPAGVEGVVCPQPVLTAALQVALLMTATASSPRAGTYTVLVAGSTAGKPGLAPVSAVGGSWPHPVVTLALQVAPSITETPAEEAMLPAELLEAKIVSVASLMPSPSGPPATVTVGGFWPHPVVVLPLQVAPSITETVLSFVLPTYTVSVCWLTASGSGKLPTGMVGGCWPQPEVSPAWHVAVLTTDTVLSLALVT